MTANLLRLINKMKPKQKTMEAKIDEDMSEIEIKKKLFPGLALPNETRSWSPVSFRFELSLNMNLLLCYYYEQHFIKLMYSIDTYSFDCKIIS